MSKYSMKKLITFIIVILLITIFSFQFNNQDKCILESDLEVCPESCGGECDDIIYSGYFINKTTGQSEEKYDAIKLKNIFLGLKDEDFGNVEAIGGTYVFGDRLYFNEEGSFNSDAQKISDKGYKTLLQNLAQRFNITLETREAVDSIVLLIE